jgi:hypothetical protein
MMVGGIVKAYVEYKNSDSLVEEQGTLLSAGLIGGDACTGILIALLTVLNVIPADAPGLLPNSCSLIAYILLALFLAFFAKKKRA